ncbi:hypothetical protein EHS13_28040 [Paenibacillus psychroresistens]|uniref:50S ribosomal protein L7/L12 n=1 Tax=Paenibacillus psychroresistens TaxID=1778678 RepID=A0A6B8RTB9_9BACL|nr:hypothetical protein [Paenibacillus psychroresistens]QGQ98458.1 hypothetical protein EHS13_28040 [Paenibacillus psychroresistens]
MQYVTKEQFDEFYNTFKNRNVIEVNELVQVMEKQFGYKADLIQPTPTLEQKGKITDAIFSNQEILQQLRQSKMDRDDGIPIYSNDIADFTKLVDEIADER